MTGKSQSFRVWSLETRSGTVVPAGKAKYDVQGKDRLEGPGRGSRARQAPGRGLFEFR